MTDEQTTESTVDTEVETLPVPTDAAWIFEQVLRLYRNGDGWCKGVAERVDHTTGKVSWCLGGAIGHVTSGNPNAMNQEEGHPDFNGYLPYANVAARLLRRALGDEPNLFLDVQKNIFGGKYYPNVARLVGWNDRQDTYEPVRRLLTALANGRPTVTLYDASSLESSTEDEQQPETD